MTDTATLAADRLFASTEFPTVPVKGERAAYPVHRIFCVGRNYAEHAKEMGVEVDREAPFYFTKSPLTIVPTGATVPYPTGTENYHYEMELVIAVGAPAWRVSPADAPKRSSATPPALTWPAATCSSRPAPSSGRGISARTSRSPR